MDENRINGTYSINNTILKAVFDYKDCNLLLFGVNSKNKPQHILVKKILTMLIASGILGYYIKKKVVGNDTSNIT